LIDLLRRAAWPRACAFLALSVLSSRTAFAADGGGFRPASFPSLSTAKPGAFSADFYVDDRDRDPWGIDVFDTGFRLRYQAPGGWEFFGDAIANRVVALPEAPAIPSAPRDLLFVGASRVMPNAFSGQHPYLDKRGEARFDAFIPGLATIGITKLLHEEGLAVGLSASLSIPLAGTLNALRSGANSGKSDAAFALLGSHDLFGGRVHMRAAYTISGKGSWTDQSFAVLGTSVTTVETRAPIGNRLDGGVAWVRPFAGSMAFALESRLSKEFVSEERLDYITPVDIMIGLHKAFGKFVFSANLLDHLRSLPNGESRPNPFAGAIDLSEVSLADRNDYLGKVGLGAAAGLVRDGTHVVALGVTSKIALPPGAVVIAPTYQISSEHNLGYVFTLTWRP
jgi:hypothetical protein